MCAVIAQPPASFVMMLRPVPPVKTGMHWSKAPAYNVSRDEWRRAYETDLAFSFRCCEFTIWCPKRMSNASLVCLCGACHTACRCKEQFISCSLGLAALSPPSRSFTVLMFALLRVCCDVCVDVCVQVRLASS